MSSTLRNDASKLVGQNIVAVRKDGSMVRGKLVRIQGDQLILEPQEGTAQTKAFVPLVLFDLLAIGTSPFVNGFGFGGGFGYGGGFGGPGFFW
ncbi:MULTISPECIES: hypothetical protein [Paenibacillus]|uniref:hypothetical protein n=1 Tax=Paenibacillus TaxID=44249 RepID=UPI00034E5255|nr:MULTISPECIES: hypothetical protein [Paenibacillus]EPD82555.1 hypothetical protein HMPREF1207_03347 [Paenibacillus sp. HGH0039]MBV6713496.1 hypothetical protein [Paenibacillus chitinolyticus]